jgi:aminobenzoyl-glutamate utilization protein B
VIPSGSLLNFLWKRSSRPGLQIDFLRREGFAIQENVSGFNTVFIATYGEGKPVIGLYGEYDADPDASNRVVPRKEEVAHEKNGHGGGHNLLGVGSIGTALAIKDLIERKKLKCTIRYYGTTAEGELGSKTYLARDGYFDDLDFSLYWHPAPATVASTGPWDALIDFDIALTAKKVNVIRSKVTAPTTTDALELLTSELKALRQTENQGAKLNYILRSSPHLLNETPDTIKFSVRIQCAKQQDANQLFVDFGDAVNRVKDQSKVQIELKVVRAKHQFLPNVAAMETVHKNLESLGAINYTEDEIEFVKQLQQHLGNVQDGISDKIIPFSDQSGRQELYGFASDIGDASWFAPKCILLSDHYQVCLCISGRNHFHRSFHRA